MIRAESSAILVDTGFPYYGKTLAKELKESLNGLPLCGILITHSHYDHAGGLARVKAAFPDAIVYAAAHARDILQRESALRAMRELNRTAAALAGAAFGASGEDADDYDINRTAEALSGVVFEAPDEDANDYDINRTAAALSGEAFEAPDEDVGGYTIDCTPGDGDRIHIGDFFFEVWETPGHTNDSLSYWFPGEGLLILSETTGVMLKRKPMTVEPAFIVSWKSSVAAVERAERARPQTIVLPHTGGLSGADVEEYFQKQKEAIIETKELVFRLTDEGKPESEILSEIQSRYYDQRSASLKACQPISAFLLNFKEMIPRLLKEGP